MQKYLLLIIALLVIGFTSLVSVPGSPFLIGDMTQADISAKYPTPITPAGFTFSIWSLIYLSWLIAGATVAGLSLTPLSKRFFPSMSLSREKGVSKNVIYSFSLAMILTALWLIPWGLQMIGLALVIMIALLSTLWYTYGISRKEAPLVRWSIELTMGWIHIATFANIAAWLAYIEYLGETLDRVYTGIFILTIAFLATLYFQLRYRAYIVSAVFLWAAIGIWYGQPPSLLSAFLVFYHLGIVGAMAYTKWGKK